MNNNIHSASSASEAVKSWWRGVEEWSLVDGLCIIVFMIIFFFMIFCLLLLLSIYRSMKEEELRWASRDGDQGRVQALLAQGVNPNAQEWWGDTPLMLAARHGREEVVELLLAQPNIDLEVRDQEGRTALLLAAEEDHQGVVEQLLAGGADAAVMDTEGRTPLWWALKNGWVDLAAQLFHHPGPVPYSLDYSDSSNISSTDSEDSSA